MRNLVLLLLFILISASTFSQEVRYFHELRGMEDSTETTHLFYRMYDATDTENYSLYANHIRHFDTQSNIDSVFLESRTRGPLYGYSTTEVGDYLFDDGNTFIPFHVTYNDEEYSNTFNYVRGYDNSFFYSGSNWINSLGSGANDTLSYFVLSMEIASIIIIEGDSLALPSIEYPYPLLVKATDDYEDCYSQNICGASDSVLIYEDFSAIKYESASDSTIFFQKNDSLFTSIDLGISKEFINDDMAWGDIFQISRISDSQNLIAETDNRYFILDRPQAQDVYTIYYSEDFGGTWSEMYSDTQRVYVSASENELAAYVASGNDIYSWNKTDSLTLLLETELEITGLYKKPNSTSLFILTTETLLHFDTVTQELGTVKQILPTYGIEPELPDQLILHQNYPNPFNPSTAISYELSANSHVNLRVFDMLGREVAELVNTQQVAGMHEVTFDASALSSGTYLYRIEANGAVQTKRFTLIK